MNYIITEVLNFLGVVGALLGLVGVIFVWREAKSYSKAQTTFALLLVSIFFMIISAIGKDLIAVIVQKFV